MATDRKNTKPKSCFADASRLNGNRSIKEYYEAKCKAEVPEYHPQHKTSPI